jgi:hypothetical protein
VFRLSIAQNIQDIRRRIGSAALVAVGKTQSGGSIREAIAAGADAVGENRVQELLEKDAQGAYQGAPLHFIGHLQKNKVNKVVGRAALIQSVDSIPLAEAIDACAGKKGMIQPVLAQVNIALEASKGGFPPNALFEALRTMNTLRHIRVRGLMCIPPYGETQWFEPMRRLYVQTGLEILSMGMSDDYELAVQAGSNMVRIGSALFGTRV